MKTKGLIILVGMLMLSPTNILGKEVKINSKIVKIFVNEGQNDLNHIGEDIFSTEDGRVYITISSLGEKLDGTLSSFDVKWDAKNKMVLINNGTNYTRVHKGKVDNIKGGTILKLGKQKLSVDGVIHELSTFTSEKNQIYYSVEDLSQIIGYHIVTQEKYKVCIETSGACKKILNKDPAYKVYSNRYDSRHGEIIGTQIDTLKNGNLQVISEGDDSKLVYICEYTKEGELISDKWISRPLPIYGGAYRGEEYNYIVYGANNSEEIPDKQVICIVKYDDNFNELDRLILTTKDTQTIEPFRSSSLRMEEIGEELIIHTSRKRTVSDDGRNHQSQLTLVVNTTDMKLQEDVSLFQNNHVSHSFNQFIREDRGEYVLVDHGDAYPRTIVLNKRAGVDYSEVDLFNIPGGIGDNVTGVSVGGLEVSSENYIVAFNTVDHNLITHYGNFDTDMKGERKEYRNIMLAVVNKDELSTNNVLNIPITKYSKEKIIVGVPQLVKINDDKFVVLWEESIKQGEDIIYDGLKYVLIDGNGNTISEIKTNDYLRLSVCPIIYVDDKLMWINDKDDIRVLCELNIE